MQYPFYTKITGVDKTFLYFFVHFLHNIYRHIKHYHHHHHANAPTYVRIQAAERLCSSNITIIAFIRSYSFLPYGGAFRSPD